MKYAVLAALLLSATAARAEDMPSEDTTTNTTTDTTTNSSQLVIPGVDDAPAETPPAAPAQAARLSITPKRAKEIVKDDGEGKLEKKEDTVAGGKHWRVKTSAGSVHVWVPPGYDRAPAGTADSVPG